MSAGLPAAAAQDTAPAPAGLAEYAVLTPGIEGQYEVASGFDPTVLLPPYLSFGSFAEQKQSRALQALIEREAYDSAKSFADSLVTKLNEAGFTAAHEPILRRPAGRIQSLGWGDIPESPRGEAIFDVTIRWLCLCAITAFDRYYPAISLQWRLLDPPREIIEPTRRIDYYHHPVYLRGKKTPPGKAPPDPATLPPVATVSEACGFQSVKAAESDPQVLWRCMDEAIAAAADRLLFELKKVRQ